MDHLEVVKTEKNRLVRGDSAIKKKIHSLTEDLEECVNKEDFQKAKEIAKVLKSIKAERTRIGIRLAMLEKLLRKMALDTLTAYNSYPFRYLPRRDVIDNALEGIEKSLENLEK